MGQPPSPQQLEEIIGQCIFAIGIGAGPIRIHRTAVRALLDRYKEHFIEVLTDDPNSWEKTSSCALDNAQVIGRAAAMRAAQAGQMSIRPEDIISAAEIVDSTAGKQGIIFRPWCIP